MPLAAMCYTYFNLLWRSLSCSVCPCVALILIYIGDLYHVQFAICGDFCPRYLKLFKKENQILTKVWYS